MYKLTINEKTTEYENVFELLTAVTQIVANHSQRLSESMDNWYKDQNRKQIFYLGKKLGLETEQIKQRVYEILGVDSMANMTLEDGDKIIRLMNEKLNNLSPANGD
jgi:hypothetical protein